MKLALCGGTPAEEIKTNKTPNNKKTLVDFREGRRLC